MILAEISNLTKQDSESSSLEFKTSTASLNSACESICGFLNHNGGTLLFGVTNNGARVGQIVTDKTQIEIANHIKKFEPSADIEIKYIPISDSKYIIVMKVTSGIHKPYTYDGRPFQRLETTTVRMPQHLYEQLLVKRGQLNHTWEEFITERFKISDLDRNEVLSTISQGIYVKRIPATASKQSISEILNSLNLVKDKQLKNAAMVLFGKKLFSGFGQCMLKMAVFEGKNKTGDFIDNQQVYGNAFKLLSEADDFTRRHMSIASFFQSDSFIRIDKPTLPVLAVREALINAICHRDYQTTATIQMAIYDDRLEIWNPGKLPIELAIKDLSKQHNSYPRNEIISNVFYSCGLIEKWGSGTLKIIELCKEHGIPEPIFEEYSGGFSVTFMFEQPTIRVVSPGKTLTGKLRLTERQQSIIHLLESAKELTGLEIFDKLGEPITSRTLRRDLSILKAHGYIDSKGKTHKTVWFRKI